jgi:hypothetical protein
LGKSARAVEGEAKQRILLSSNGDSDVNVEKRSMERDDEIVSRFSADSKVSLKGSGVGVRRGGGWEGPLPFRKRIREGPIQIGGCARHRVPSRALHVALRLRLEVQPLIY